MKISGQKIKVRKKDDAAGKRRLQLAEAQSRRRGRFEEEGKALLQGLVSKDVRRRYAVLKINLGAESLGHVMTRLLEFWESKHVNR